MAAGCGRHAHWRTGLKSLKVIGVTVMIDRMRGSTVNEPLHAYLRLIDVLDGDNVAVPSKWRPARKRVFAARGF